ncbi:aminoglycoside phosphotransferase [Marmoricola endophyticus]|uniref:Maltokinase n=2 Tax=Marmoricola endophyticus TaxID=2040280 RepID=A0A917BF72_9ACTN|nr:aminoglycoside phosphotransferase [Marmoricola endophyticus]
MTAYLDRARWFGGKGRDHRVTDVRRVATLPGPPAVTIDIVTVRYPDGSEELYQLPLAHYPEPQERITHALVGPHTDDALGSVHSYDAVHDREAMAVYLRAFAATAPEDTSRVGGLVFHRIAEHELDTETHSTLFSGEQSNSSVAFGDDSLLKVFRKVTPGSNPDIEVHRELTRAGSPHVAALYGWAETDEGTSAEPIDLAMIQQFLRTASDGWDLALAGVRTLLAEADELAEPRPGERLDDDEVVLRSGGDFAGESERLGTAVAEVHEVLRDHFPTTRWGAADVAAIADGMDARLEAQVRDLAALVPTLALHAPALRDVFDAVRHLDVSLTAQRVHGDLHLGQTLRVVHNWKLVDFEGEPAKPLAERVLPDSPWRDVAGMLRSFDYAARSVERDFADGAGEDAAVLSSRASAWAERNRAAFLAGYAGSTALTDSDRVLLAAYEADKAVYEIGYEARNRPGWVDIPLAALARLTGSGEDT